MNLHDCTFYGLHTWHNAMFEKLGWMVMAKEHNSKLKISSYLDSICCLQTCIEKKITETKDEDRKDDLKILLENERCLECYSEKLAKISLTEHKNKMHKATNCGLQHWMRKKYEHLGWMCLSQSHGNMLNVKAYFESLKTLISSLEKKINDVNEKDRKDDLEITLENTKILKRAAWRLLMEGNNKKMMKKSSVTKKSSTSSKSSKTSMSKKSKKTPQGTNWF